MSFSYNDFRRTMESVINADYSSTPNGIMESDVVVMYRKNGVPHRIGGPSTFYRLVQRVMWDVDGKKYDKTGEYCVACDFDEVTTMSWVLKYGDELPTVMSEQEYGLFNNT